MIIFSVPLSSTSTFCYSSFSHLVRQEATTTTICVSCQAFAPQRAQSQCPSSSNFLAKVHLILIASRPRGQTRLNLATSNSPTRSTTSTSTTGILLPTYWLPMASEAAGPLNKSCRRRRGQKYESGLPLHYEWVIYMVKGNQSLVLFAYKHYN